LEATLGLQFTQLDLQVGNILDELDTALAEAKIVPDGFDLSCN
jgi:hypothetical protein